MSPGRGTARRSIRIPEELWQAAKRTADERGEDLASVVRAALARYVKRHEKRKSAERG